ncbi:MAG TPA: DUF2974 domain-containing protein [Candidatus Scatomorpha intestinavium]|uniref:DUF2974 domain-containing protein n=1 Tax=Candidatus Scatomorpha intestinavium TaxID=2840922 RepID=A0A9D0ZDT6_9FIRM|nr:DUF2974 domain-containing protein [Candidatus Scatomorpha intestinavium]
MKTSEMANAIDYIDWRGDLSFDVSPFNEVDNLLLCRLTSLDFTGIVPADGEMPLAEAARLYFERYGDEDRRLGVLLAPGSVTMVKRMLQSARFSRLVLADYENRVDERRELQFCAVTVLVPDGTAFVAFRGTDDTLVAWKEDFYMGSMRTVPAQEEAAAYLCRAAWRYEQPLRVGGHSKGGNLSVYAAMSAPEEVQARLLDVYNNDGPGFRDSVGGTEGYRRVKERIHTILPQYSLVGVLLKTDDDFEIVESCETGISAHNGFTWQVKGRRFVRCADFPFRTRVFSEAMRGWTEDLSYDERRELTNLFFGALESTGARTLTDLTAQKLRKAAAVTRELLSREENRAMLADKFELLLREYIASAKKELPRGRMRVKRGRDR